MNKSQCCLVIVCFALSYLYLLGVTGSRSKQSLTTFYCFQHQPGADNDRDDPVVGHGVANFFGRPMTTKSSSSWNPFRKKSGILNVIHAQSKRNRIVSKHGRINTYVRNVDDVEPYRSVF